LAYVEKVIDIDIMERSRVYKIKCGRCNFMYIGQTGRSFNTRIREHLDLKRPSQVRDHLCEFVIELVICVFCDT
jgi:hypothetical protein